MIQISCGSFSLKLAIVENYMTNNLAFKFLLFFFVKKKEDKYCLGKKIGRERKVNNIFMMNNILYWYNCGIINYSINYLNLNLMNWIIVITFIYSRCLRNCEKWRGAKCQNPYFTIIRLQIWAFGRKIF